MLPKNAGLQGMCAPDLGDGVAEAGQILVRIKTPCSAALEAAVGADIGGFARAGQIRELHHIVLEQALIAVTDLCPVYFRRILENIGEADKRVSENDLICHRRIE